MVSVSETKVALENVKYHTIKSIDDPTDWRGGRHKWTFLVWLKLSVYFACCLIGVLTVPNVIWDIETRQITFVIGALGIWRYGWWFTHAVRAYIYGKFVYPRMRREGQNIWESGWRPRHLHFMMTTYKEHRKITEMVVRSIIREIADSGVSGTIWLGSSDRYDEDIIQNFLAREAAGLDLTLRIIRQNVSGKRAAIGLVLRAMSRSSVQDDDLVIFMDGDFILDKGAISRCMPLFKLYPDLQACTTDEEVICIGPRWVENWLKMRFSQRRLAMQSHALSRRVLTLTGRMSVFRARHLLQYEFIRLLEADHLSHWLWGDFRFLSGDDKSTWYYMLKSGAHMRYVPDALGYTVEVIEGSGLDRMVQNFRRWSGNMLRNGARAIALGPRRMPLFIWWCLVDQRLSMWTMLVSPVLALCATFIKGFAYLLSYILFIAISRMLLSLFLFGYSRRVIMHYPWILYFNQLINAAVKVYCIFRLSKQRWSNRGNQSAGLDGGSLLEVYRDNMANWCTFVSVVLLFIVTLHYSGLIPVPSQEILRSVAGF
ncbi:glycosyltransferase [Coralliovum pocilloporae]|uniref:glycosyltransferase n=1 Tax=Coralliovum pocilloporae TaxID=3066369 RepID=UPI003306EA1C